MYRFLLRPKWLGFHLLVLAAIVAMINLGLWQLRRLDQRQAFNATVEARYDEAPRPLDDVLVAGADPADLEWTPVIATGTYLPEETVHIVNRSQNGSAGDNIVVPLQLDDGRLLLVNRGFVPQEFEVPPAPTGEVTVAGRLRPSQQRRLGQLSDPSDGQLEDMQRVDIERFQAQVDGEIVPMYIDVYQSEPPEPPQVEPVAKPDLSEGPHRSYAVQWFIFTIAAGAGWVLAVRRSVATRRRELASAGDADPVSGEPLGELDHR